jgi:hypothetical protein
LDRMPKCALELLRIAGNTLEDDRKRC